MQNCKFDKILYFFRMKIIPRTLPRLIPQFVQSVVKPRRNLKGSELLRQNDKKKKKNYIMDSR